MDPKPLNRQQLAKICGNDPEAIRLLERLFIVAGQVLPNQIDQGFGGDIAGQIEALRNEVNSYAELVQRATEVIAASDLSGRQEYYNEDYIAPAPKEMRRHCYGQFYDTTTQTALAINTAYPISFNTTDISLGVWLDGTSIKVSEAGIYNFQMSVQLDKASASVGHFFFWWRKNGVDVSNSASTVRIQGSDAEVFTAMNLFIPMGPLDDVQLMWSTDDTDVEIAAFPASAPVPAIPSIILTVSNNLEGDK